MLTGINFKILLEFCINKCDSQRINNCQLYIKLYLQSNNNTEDINLWWSIITRSKLNMHHNSPYVSGNYPIDPNSSLNHPISYLDLQQQKPEICKQLNTDKLLGPKLEGKLVLQGPGFIVREGPLLTGMVTSDTSYRS